MFRKALAGTAAFMKYLSAGLIGAVVGINLLAVAARYFFNWPIMWCEEVSLLLFVWAVLCSLVPVTFARAGIALDFFVDLLPPSLRGAVSVLTGLTGAAVLAATCWFCLDLMRRSQFRLSPILMFPYRYVYLSLLVGLGLSALVMLVHACGDAAALARGEFREGK
ncbi:MAG: TRAP transporter small permease subunit [Planctomycetota bacterium]|jgi:TRAP-type C4-dicarboxylate transport system permease small subunit|nr:TRAP transporter small permease subunit [Planctomycetota bacterium]